MRIEIGNGATALTELARCAGGSVRPFEDGEFPYVTHLATDSREVCEGTLFLGIRGDRVDGNDYCAAAFTNGASAVLCERAPEAGAAIVTDDTVIALGKIADAYKRKCACRTVAVTGSVGKTTTKDLIYAVLSQKYKTHASKGNFNSNIGLPMSMLEMPKECESAVFELGMSALLEIDYLSRLVKPDIGIITNIGTAHMESLGSRENIARAKLEILNGMSVGGTVLLNGEEPLLRAAKEKILSLGIRPVYISVSENEKISEYSDFRAENIRQEIGQTIFDIRFGETVIRDLRLKVMGIHTVYAALLAAAVGILEGVSESGIRAGLLSFRTAPMRQSVERIGGITVIEDCYNASPESMRAALSVGETLVKQQGSGRLLALLGDMRELGASSGDLHRAVGRCAAEKGAVKLFAFGELSSQYLADGALSGGLAEENIFRFADAEAFEDIGSAVLTEIRRDDVLLVKASRALRAERVVRFLKEQLG